MILEVITIISIGIGIFLGARSAITEYELEKVWVKILFGFLGGCVGLFMGAIIPVLCLTLSLVIGGSIFGTWEDCSTSEKIEDVYYNDGEYYISIRDTLTVIDEDDLTIIEGDSMLITNSDVLVDDEYWGGLNRQSNCIYILSVPELKVKDKQIKILD